MDDQALGRSRVGLSTKIHLAGDGRGRPLAIPPTPGRRHDGLCARPLPERIRLLRTGPGRPHCRFDQVIADKAYSSRGFRAYLRNAASHTPSRRRPTSGVTGTTAAVAVVDHQDSTGRSTDDATSLSAASTASRASVESPPDTKRPPPRTKQWSVSRRFHSGQDPFEDEPRTPTGKVRRVVAGGAGFAKIRFEPCPGASTVAR